MMTELYFHKRILFILITVLLLFSFLGFLSINVLALETPNVSADSYEEYLEITEMPAFTDHLIRYEQIKALGAFGMFVGPHYPYSYPVNRPVGDIFLDETLYYIVVDQNSFELALYIGELTTTVPKERVEKEAISMPSGLHDMRHLNSDETGYIVRGPLIYRYSKGELTGVQWFMGDRCFHLFPNPYKSSTLKGDADIKLATYPTDRENTICNRLLSRNYLVALSAYYTLIRDIPLQSGETWFSRIQYILLPVLGFILLIAACITAIWLILHIRRKQRVMFPTKWHNRRCKNSAPDDTEN